MPRQEKKLQQNFIKKISNKYNSKDSGIKKINVNGLSGSNKFINWLYDCKNGTKSIDFAFIGDSNNTAEASLETNYTNNPSNSYGINTNSTNNRYASIWGYINGFANALLNNNFNLYGGPIESILQLKPTDPANFSSSYGGGGGGSVPSIGAAQTGIGLSHYSLTPIWANPFDMLFGLNMGSSSYPGFVMKNRGKATPRSINLNSDVFYKFSSTTIPSATNKIPGIFAKSYFGDSYFNQFNSEKSALNLFREFFDTANAGTDALPGGLVPYYFGPEYELQGNLNSSYILCGNNPLLSKENLTYRILAWESSESNGFFPMSMYYGDKDMGTYNAYTHQMPTPDALGSKGDVSGSDLRSTTRKCRYFKGKLIIDPTRSNANEKICFVIEQWSNDGTTTFTSPLLYGNTANNYNTKTGQIRENGFFKIINKGAGNSFTLIPYGHSVTSPAEEGFYNALNSTGAGNHTAGGGVSNINVNTRVFLKLNVTPGSAGLVAAGTPITIANDSLIQADMLAGYSSSLSATPITLAGFSSNTISVLANGTALNNSNTIGINSVNVLNNTITFDKNLQISDSATECVLVSTNSHRIPIINVLTKISSWDNNGGIEQGAIWNTNEHYIMKDGSNNNITSRTVFSNVIVEYVSTTTLGIHNYSTSPRSGRPLNTQIKPQLPVRNNLIPNSNSLSDFTTISGTVTTTSNVTINTYSSLTSKNLDTNLSEIRYVVPKTELYSGSGQFYFDSVSDSTFSIWVKFNNVNAKLGLSLEREENDLSHTSGTTLISWGTDPSILNKTNVGMGIIGGNAGPAWTGTNETTSCNWVEGETGSSSADYTISNSKNDWSNATGSDVGARARFTVTSNSNGLNKWVRISISRTSWFNRIRVVNIGGSTREIVSVALPQLETFVNASTNILTTGTPSKSTGSWKPFEAIYRPKWEASEFNKLAPSEILLNWPPSNLTFSFDYWGSKLRKGPFSIAAHSVYTPEYGFAINSLYSLSGGKIFDSSTTNTHDFYKAILECTPQGSNPNNTTLRTIFKEYRSRQLAATANKSGNVCIIIQGGANDAASTNTATNVVNNIKLLTNLLYSEWAALNYPESDFHVVYMISHLKNKATALDDDTRLIAYANEMQNQLLLDEAFANKITFIDTQKFVTSQELVDNTLYMFTNNVYCDIHPDTLINAWNGSSSNIQVGKLYKIHTLDGSPSFTSIGSRNNTVGTVFRATGTATSGFGASKVIELNTGKLGIPNYTATNNDGLLHLHAKGYNYVANKIISRILSARL